MSLLTDRDFTSLRHEILDNRLVIRRAVQNSQGVFYDLSIGIDGANFNNGISPNLDSKIQIVVQGCLHALQAQLAAQNRIVDKLDQLGFIIQKPAADRPYESHALVAAAGQSVLEQIKKCPPRNYSSLSSLYSGDTAQMKWRPDDIGQINWTDLSANGANYSVHDGLTQLCEDIQNESFFGFSQSSPQTISTHSSGHEPASSHIDSPDSHTPPPPVDSRLPQEGSLPGVVPPVTPAQPQASPVHPSIHEETGSEDDVINPVYNTWQRRQRGYGSFLKIRDNLWDRISLAQLRGQEEISKAADRQVVQAAVQAQTAAIQQLYVEFLKAAPRYYRAIFGSETQAERISKDGGTEKTFYEDYIRTQLIEPIQTHWAT